VSSDTRTKEIGSESKKPDRLGGYGQWEEDSISIGVQDVSGLAGCEKVVVRMSSFDTLFTTNFYKILITPHSSLCSFTGHS